MLSPDHHRVYTDWQPNTGNLVVSGDHRDWKVSINYSLGEPNGVGKLHEGEPWGDSQTRTEVVHPDGLPLDVPRYVVWVPQGEYFGFQDGWASNRTNYFHIDEGFAKVKLGPNPALIVVNFDLQSAAAVIGENTYTVTPANSFQSGHYVQLPGGAEMFHFDPRVGQPA